MKKIKLCFLWHQHQPFYKDTVNQIYRMPWVLMHSWKDYYDMLHLVLQNEIKVTFNLVPSLLYQIQDYIKNPFQDELYSILEKEPSLVSEQELRRLFVYAFDTMNHRKIQNHPGYHKLLLRYQHKENFSKQDILDLQVLLCLNWFGEYSFRTNPELNKLKQKRERYTPLEKNLVLNWGQEILKKIIPAHKKAFHENHIEITTTPFFHPILPLLNSFLSARVAEPNLPLPSVEANMQEDVDAQIAFGKKYAEELFQKEIQGFWPSEGAVSADIMPDFAKNKVRYVATDAGILINSLRLSNQTFQKADLYYPYSFSTKYGDVVIFFRDTELSDLIGFTYAHWETQAAVQDFIEKLAQIKNLFENSEDTPVVSVILDGENAWESYPDNGYPFLNLLYQTIKKTEWIETCTFSEVLHQNPKIRPLPKLFSGSWIYSNLNTWIGHKEKNLAWELLVEARKVYAHARDIPAELKEKATFELFAAEGSDWFWWYGDDFYTHFADDFDALFRLHLRNVYAYLKQETPPQVERSIRGKHRSGLIRRPTSLLKPLLRGDLFGFFDWLGAGEFDLTFGVSTMQISERKLKKLLYGPGEYEKKIGIYFCLIGDFTDNGESLLEMEIMDGLTAKLIWDLEKQQFVKVENLEKEQVVFVQKESLQWFIPANPQETYLELQFKLWEKGRLKEIAPLYSRAKIPISLEKVPDWVI